MGVLMAVTSDPITQSSLDRKLAAVPRFLSSHFHVIFLLGLGVYLIVLPLCGIRVPESAELIGGNYTNVTSDIGACIAAGMTVHIHGQNKQLHAKVCALTAPAQTAAGG
jgi:cyanate permease